jgi:D-alanyl-D-alanine carboxypeptidase (penicillin-binding protein 5/6)
MKVQEILISLLWFLTLNPQLHAESFNPEELSAPSLVLMDENNGRILFIRNGDTTYPPASLTKLVTMYLALEATEEGRFGYDDQFLIDETGSSFSRPDGSSLMLLEEGQTVTWMDLLRGLAIASGNDAAYAVAEIIGGEIDSFVALMNQTAVGLGFSFHFEDPDGWSENNRVTPLGMARFSIHYIKRFPEALSLFHDDRFMDYPLDRNRISGQSYKITGTRHKANTNLLLGCVEGVDGLKTGYIEESGFHFIATAQRGYTRLVAVVMGLKDEDYFKGLENRAWEAAKLLEYGFIKYKTRKILLPSGLYIPLHKGKISRIPVVMQGNTLITLSTEESETAICVIELDRVPTAPINNNDIIGTMIIWNEYLPFECPILSGMSVEKRKIVCFPTGD